MSQDVDADHAEFWESKMVACTWCGSVFHAPNRLDVEVRQRRMPMAGDRIETRKNCRTCEQSVSVRVMG